MVYRIGTVGKYMANKYMAKKVPVKENKMAFEAFLLLFIIKVKMKEEQEM